MPIINRPVGQNTTVEAPQIESPSAEIGSTQRGKVQGSGRPKTAKLGMLAIYALVLFLSICLPFGAYFLYGKLKGSAVELLTTERSKAPGPEAEAVDISLSLLQLAKVGSLASLSKKEFEQNFVSLAEAEKTGSTTVISALEIVVNKNRQDSAKYKEDLITILMEMNQIYIRNAQSVKAQIGMAIAAAEGKKSSESARVLRMGLKALEGAPANGDLKEYMSAAIEQQL